MRKIILALLLGGAASCARAESDAAAAAAREVFAPMQAEMDRALKGLKAGALGPPYFLGYRLTDHKVFRLEASFGSLVQEVADSFRTLYVEARVGDKSLDNTDLRFQGWHQAAGRGPEALRQNLWALTDKAYKSALAGFLEKKAERATEFIAEELDDFSVEPSTVHLSAPDRGAPDRAALRALLERGSAAFRGYPFVYSCSASVHWAGASRYLLTSEGTRLATPANNSPGLLSLSAGTRSADGMRIDNHWNWTFLDASDLPTAEQLEVRARRMAEEIGLQRQAPLQAPMAAPAILDPEVTGVLFHEALGHKLEGQRQRDPRQSQIFKDLVGKKVIPEFLSLSDDPSLASFRGAALGGHYEFDSEGVPARKVVLVERGILRNFLMSRWPVKGFSGSNGHGRSDAYHHPIGRMANLIVSAEGAVAPAALKKKLRALCRATGKPYGFLLVGSFGGENPNARSAAQTLEVRPRLIYRIDAATGAETLVRGVKMVGTPLVVLNRIVAAGSDDALSNGFHCGAESGMIPVSQIAPSVLLSEVELQRLPEERSLPPLLPSPFHDAR